jgi:Xaa-Pro aminopeptidase
LQLSSELENKLLRIRAVLNENALDALLLRRADNFAWATCGAASHINLASTLGAASLLITPTARYLITDNIEAPRMEQEEGLQAQGWGFRVSQWHADNDALPGLIKDLKVGADFSLPGTMDLSTQIASLRACLTPEEGDRFRELGRCCASAMNVAARAIRPGMTELEIAAGLASQAWCRGIEPTVNLIATDERIFRFRHPLPTGRKMDRYAMLVLCGRRWGLVCSITRLVHFGPLPEELRRKAEAVARIDAEMIAATRPHRTIRDVLRKAQDTYAAVGFSDEWRLHHQGGLAGYAPREVIATPSSTQPILLGQVYAWNPSISGVKSEDTILVGEQNNEIITEMQDWPTIQVQADNQTVQRPAILEREPL